MIIKERINWIDLSKGFAILFMVIGHTSIPETLSKYIWSFHMPLFFFVSGMFLKNSLNKSFKDLLKKKISSLIVPYIFFSIIVFCGYLGTEYHRPYEIICGWQGYALWFVPVLFFSELLVWSIVKCLNSRTIYGDKIPYVFVYLILYLLSISLLKYDIKIPYKIDCVPLCSIFVLTGFLYDIWYKNKVKFPLSAIVVSLIISIVLSQILPKTGLGRNELGYGLPNFVNALLGIFVYFGIAIKSDSLSLSKHSIIYKFVKWCGENSIFIMAFSQLFNYWLLRGLSILNIPSTICLVLRYVLLFAFIFLSGYLLTKYMPKYVGKKR